MTYRRLAHAVLVLAVLAGTAVAVTPVPGAGAATPALPSTLLATLQGKHIEPSPTIRAANDTPTVFVWDREAVQGHQLVAPANGAPTSGYDAVPIDIEGVNEHDLAVGVGPDNMPVVWQVGPQNAYRTVDISALTPSGDQIMSTTAVVDDAGEIAGSWYADNANGYDGQGGFYLSSPGASPTAVRSPAGGGPARITAMNADWEVVLDLGSSTSYLVDRSDGSSTALSGSVAARGLTADGTVLIGNVVRHPDGSTTTLSGLSGFGGEIADNGTVVGYDSAGPVAYDAAGTKTDLTTATGLGLSDATVTPHGRIIVDSGGTDADNNESIAVYSVGAGESVTGTVRNGTAANQVSSPVTPAAGVDVTVAGTTAAGAAFTTSVSTDDAGKYGVDAPPGDYTVTFPSDVCVAATTPTCAQHTPVSVDAAKDPVTVDAVALRAALHVTVVASPKQAALAIDRSTGKIEPRTIDVTVRITNDGASRVTDVHAPSRLIVGYHDPQDVSEPVVPLRPGTGPKPKADLGALAPGRSTTATYTLRAEGDGRYDVQAVVTAADAKDHTVKGTGSALVQIGSPVLVMTTGRGREVKAAGTGGKLVKAGTAYSIDLTFDNRSYVKTVDVTPYYCGLAGNATDGHVQGVDAPIQGVVNDRDLVPSEAYRIAPRHKVELACVIRTTNTPTETTGEPGHDAGTRSTVTLRDPVAYTVTKNDQGEWVKGDRLTGTDVFVDGESSFVTSLADTDDTAGNYETGDGGVSSWYLTKGVFNGLWGLTGGALSGMFRALPSLLASGLRAVPAALVTYVNDEMELWEAAKHDPVAMAAFLSIFTNTALIEYKHTPELIGNAQDFVKKFDTEVATRFDGIANDWYHGRQLQGLEEFSEEFTSDAGNAVLALGPGILARCPKVLAAFKAAKASLYAGLTEDLAAYAPRLVNVFDASTVIDKVLKAGYEMTNAHLRQFFGLTNTEAAFLRTFARENKLLIVVRSRAAESIRWIKRYGAVLKPESIKIKNVSWLDYRYLGYAESDIGRVVINTKLPTEAEVISTLRGRGVARGSAEWDSALARLGQRHKELVKESAGYYQELADAAKTGHMEMKWNFADNAVDPTAYTGSTTRYRFRMQPKPGSAHQLVPEYFVKGKWRSITGDVDFLQITHADGRALSDAARVRIYQALSKSPLGFMHPESATWQLGSDFDFAAKINEFERAGTVAQFGPDGAVRAVDFVKKLSFFQNKGLYRIFWEGGYQVPWST